MKFGIMEGFRMHNTQVSYGLSPNGARVALFSRARELGFQGIEFGIDLNYREDQLWTGAGDIRQAMRAAAQNTGVEAASICLHLLNYKEHSPASNYAGHREIARELIRNTIEACAHIGASVILLPFFGTAALKSEEQIQRLIREMKQLAPIAEDKSVCLALESSLNAANMIRIVETIGSDYAQVYFDTGNTAGIGYDIVPEIEALGKHIIQTHIKDSPTSRMLGEGNIDFGSTLATLQGSGFRGYLMLETPSTEDSVAAAAKNLAYIKNVVETLSGGQT